MPFFLVTHKELHGALGGRHIPVQGVDAAIAQHGPSLNLPGFLKAIGIHSAHPASSKDQAALPVQTRSRLHAGEHVQQRGLGSVGGRCHIGTQLQVEDVAARGRCSFGSALSIACSFLLRLGTMCLFLC